MLACDATDSESREDGWSERYVSGRLLLSLPLTEDIDHGADDRTWQKLGDLSTIAYAVGLHHPSVCIDHASAAFLVEIRKRVLASVYAIDTKLALALGRPPQICSRYSLIQLPMGISYQKSWHS